LLTAAALRSGRAAVPITDVPPPSDHAVMLQFEVPRSLVGEAPGRVRARTAGPGAVPSQPVQRSAS
jgi:hypothetical protein